MIGCDWFSWLLMRRVFGRGSFSSIEHMMRIWSRTHKHFKENRNYLWALLTSILFRFFFSAFRIFLWWVGACFYDIFLLKPLLSFHALKFSYKDFLWTAFIWRRRQDWVLKSLAQILQYRSKCCLIKCSSISSADLKYNLWSWHQLIVYFFPILMFFRFVLI